MGDAPKAAGAPPTKPKGKPKPRNGKGKSPRAGAALVQEPVIERYEQAIRVYANAAPGKPRSGGGEYVHPRPAYLDPIGDVPRKRPVYYIRDRPNVTLDPKVVVHRSAVRNALSTVGFDSTKLAQLGNHGPRLCWELTPRNRLRYRIPPDGTEPEEDWEVTLAERNPWRNP